MMLETEDRFIKVIDNQWSSLVTCSLDFKLIKDSPALYEKFCRAIFGSRDIEFIRYFVS